MKLTDIASIDQWAEIEKEAFEKFGLQSSVFNKEGVRITDTKNFANKLCPQIKSTDKGQAFICATAHMNMANEADRTGKPVIEECDAGLLKIVVPIFYNDEFLGAAGGCGLLTSDGEVDTFAVNKITGIDEAEVEKLSEGIPAIDEDTARSVSDYFAEKVNELVRKKG